MAGLVPAIDVLLECLAERRRCPRHRRAKRRRPSDGYARARRDEAPHALSTVLLAGNPGPRRIRAAGAGGCRRRLRRRRAHERRHGPHAGDDGRRARQASAVRAAVPEGGQARRRAGRRDSVLSRAAAEAQPPRRGRPALAASVAAHGHGLREGNPRHPSPAWRRALLRGCQARGEALHRKFPAKPRTEISRLFRNRAGEERRPERARPQARLRRFVFISADRGPALRLSQRDEAHRAQNSARGRACTTGCGSVRASRPTLPRRDGCRSTSWGFSGITRNWTTSLSPARAAACRRPSPASTRSA